MTKTPYLFKLVGGQAYLIKRRERYLEWNEGRGAGGNGNALSSENFSIAGINNTIAASNKKCYNVHIK